MKRLVSSERVSSASISRGESTMDQHKFRDIWKEQCRAARSVRAQHGVLSAPDYLIGEKLLSYAETAMTRPEFARELPRFVAEVRDIFTGERRSTVSRLRTRRTTNCLMTLLIGLPQRGCASPN
jgi:hypothetical protein